MLNKIKSPSNHIVMYLEGQLWPFATCIKPFLKEVAILLLKIEKNPQLRKTKVLELSMSQLL